MRFAFRRIGAAVACGAMMATVIARTASADVPAVLGAVEFVPADFVTGQAVDAYSRLDAGGALWREETVSSGMPDSGRRGVQVLSASVERKSGAPLLVVRFISWRPGPGQLPALSVGGMEIPPIQFDCGSALVGGDKSAPEPLPQMDPPGLFSRVYVLGGIALAAAIGAVVAAMKLGPWIRSLLAKWAYAQARREFDALLESLEGKGSSQALWAELCSGLRRFIGVRAGYDWSAFTPAEIRELAIDAAPGGVCPDAAVALGMGDDARFSGRDDLCLASGIALARSIADRLDAATAERPPREARA